jgi:hypothetical protein
VLHPCPLLVDIYYYNDYNKPRTCGFLVIKHLKCFEILELRLPVMELERSSYLNRSVRSYLVYTFRSYLIRSCRSYRARFYSHLFHLNLPYLYLTHLTHPTRTLTHTLTRHVNELPIALAPSLSPALYRTPHGPSCPLLLHHTSSFLLPSLSFFLPSFLPSFLT